MEKRDTEKKRVDDRIIDLIRNSINNHYRYIVAIYGKHAYQQIEHIYNLHLNIDGTRNKNVLWMRSKWKDNVNSFKSDLKLPKNKLKRHKTSSNTIFPHANVLRLQYKNVGRCLGNTYQIIIFQDFNEMTPNILAQVVETCEGKGLILFIMDSNPDEFVNMKMNVHTRYTTEKFKDIESPQFNKRFLNSLLKSPGCLVMDDYLTVLQPQNTHSIQIEHVEFEPQPYSKSQGEIFRLLQYTKSKDQHLVLEKLFNFITLHDKLSTFVATSPRGCGKSALVGMAIAAAIYEGYPTVAVTAPCAENVTCLFKHIISSLELLKYEQHKHFTVSLSSNSKKQVYTEIQIFKNHRQSIKYYEPNKLSGEFSMIVIDEASAIPISTLRTFLNCKFFVLTCTTQGYEGTGRSLKLKFMREISKYRNVGECQYEQYEMSDTIRYANEDFVDKWLSDLLILKEAPISIDPTCPELNSVRLYKVNKKLLFSMNKTAENILISIISNFITAHYKNSPNDLQMLADAPAHEIYILIDKKRFDPKHFNDMCIICTMQVTMEGNITENFSKSNLFRGEQPAGDLVPWTIMKQFQDFKFGILSGCRIVRIATNSLYYRFGFASKCVQLFMSYCGILDDDCNGDQCDESNDASDNTLLTDVESLKYLDCDYVSVCYGMSFHLLKFWNKNSFLTTFISQKMNDLTGEHSSIAIRFKEKYQNNMNTYIQDFRSRFLHLLSYGFAQMDSKVVIYLLNMWNKSEISTELKYKDLSDSDLSRLTAYTNNLVDYHIILDLIKRVSMIVFFNENFVNMNNSKKAILIGMGLQNKTISKLAQELSMSELTILAFLPAIIKQFLKVMF
ncbi:hypothetical protein A3Q56_04379 [Intoshia linei]|uniref:RNA cytidine acetyltransferase n=1 Tax=Intoshia linei TaxID=1819745 RepID=A0A177B2P0_9BILA|nr:hypothetical protein A3Q56_04379 [Intoshia linei]